MVTAVGSQAEAAVAKYLTSQGFSILAQNWKTKICEIDIVAKAKKSNVINFIEVKYRVREDQGTGFEYITAKKLNQLKFAARVWCANNNWDGDYRLVAAEVSGQDFENIEIVEVG